MRTFSVLALVALILSLAPRARSQSTPTNPAILYVSVTGLDSNDGLSWQTAKGTIQAAVSSCPVTGCTIHVGDGNFTISTQVNDVGNPVVILLGRGTYSTPLANPFLLKNPGSSLIGAKTTDTAGGTSAGSIIDYTGTAQVNFVEVGSPTSAFSAGAVENLDFNFGSATAGSNGVVAWAPNRTLFQNLMTTTMPGVLTVSGEVGAVGDGATTTFTFDLQNIPAIEYDPNKASGLRLSVSAGSVTGDDNGDGTISGTGVSGTVGYSNGEISVTFTTAPPSGTNITANYSAGGYLLALISTKENGLGIRQSPLNFGVEQVNGRNTTAKILVQGEATGGAGSTPSYARDAVIEQADGGQFEINWSNQITLIRDSTDSNVPGSPNPAFSFVEDTSAFFFAGTCGSQTNGVSTYLSTTANLYFLPDDCAGAPPIPGAAVNGTPYVQLPESTFSFDNTKDQSVVNGQNLGTLAIAALAQGNTAQGPFTNWLSSLALIGPYPAPGSDVAPVNTATSHNGAPNGPGETGTTNAVDVPPGATAIAGLCSSAEASCFIEVSNLGVTDSKSDTFSAVTFTGANSSLLYATNMVGGSTTFSLRDETPVSGNYQDTGQVLVVTNFGSFDGPAKALSFGSTTGNPTTTTTTYTTSVAGDLLAVFLGAPGDGGSCATGSKITVQVGSALASYINTNVDGGGVYSVSGIFVIGAPTAGTYTISATMTGLCDVGSMNVLAIEPAVAGPLAAPPTVRQFAESDYNYLFGLPPSEANSFAEAGNLVPLCNVLPTATYTLAYNNGCWGPEAAATGAVTSVSGTANQIASTGGTTPVLSLTNPLIFPGEATFHLGVTSAGSFNIPVGVAPTSPASGDFWNLGTGQFQLFDGTNTYTFARIDAAPTTGHCVEFSGTTGLLTDAGAACGGGSGTVTGTGTANTLPLWTSSSAQGNSAITQTTNENQDSLAFNILSNPQTYQCTNDTSTGTTALGLVINSSTGCKAASATDTGDLIGGAFSGAGITGSVDVAWAGRSECKFDAGVTLNDLVVLDTVHPPYCLDGGATSPSGVEVVGRVYSPTNASAGNYLVSWFPWDVAATTSSGGGGGGGGKGGLSGMTAGQVPIAATATTVTSSKALVGTDAGIATAGTLSSTPTLACSDANGGLTTSGCPSTASIPSASTNLKTAAPIQVPGSAVSFSPDPVVCTGNPGIVNCTPQRDPIAGQMYGVYFDPGETPTCTDITDSQGNTITTVVPAGLGYLTFNYFTPTTTAADTFTTHCSSNNEIMKMTMTQYFNASGVESTTNTSADSCGTVGIPCTSTVTTGQPGDLLMSFINMDETNYSTGPFGGYGPLTVSPQGVLYSQSAGYGADNFSASAAPTGGAYSVSSVNAGDGTGWTRSAVFGIIPATPLVGTAVVESQTSVTTLTSITFSQTVTVGNTMVLSVSADHMTTPNSCLPVSSLGNVFVNMDGVDNGTNRHYYAPITVGGSSDTISFPAACSNSAAGAELAVAMQMKGSFTVAIISGTMGSNTGTYAESTAADNATLILLATNFFNAVAYTFSPGLDVLSSSSTINSYALGIGQLSPPGSYTYIANGNNNYSQYTGFLLYPTVQPTYPQQPRVSALPDLGAPVTTLTLPFASTLNFDAGVAHGWDVMLTGNVTATTFTGGANGQSYDFTFSQTAPGGYSVTAPTNVNVTNWPTLNPTGVTTAHATYEGATSTLVFSTPQIPTLCISPASPATCANDSAGFVTVAPSASSVVVDSTSVTANSVIAVHEDSSIGGSLGVTCDATANGFPPEVTARAPGTSFTITTPTALSTNPGCYSYAIENPVTLIDSPPVQNGLIYHWVANDETYANAALATTLHDFSGTKSNATVVSGSTGATFQTNAHNSRSSFLFPGTVNGDYSIANAQAPSSLTEFWIIQNLTSASISAMTSGSAGALSFYINSGAVGELTIDSDGCGTIGQSTTDVAANAWAVVAVTYIASTGAYAFYVNGAAAGSGTGTTGCGGAPISSVGYDPLRTRDSALQMPEGLLYNRALSATEITSVSTWLSTR